MWVTLFVLLLPVASCTSNVVRLEVRDPDGIISRGFTLMATQAEDERILTAQEENTFELSETSPLALFAHHASTGEQELMKIHRSALFGATGEPKVPASQLRRFEAMHFVDGMVELRRPVPFSHGEAHATLLYEGTSTTETDDGKAPHFVQSLVLLLRRGGAPLAAPAVPLVAVSPAVAAEALMPPAESPADEAADAAVVVVPRAEGRAREAQVARDKGRDLGDPWHVKFLPVDGERFEVSVRSTVRYQEEMLLSAAGVGGGGRRATRRMASLRGAARQRPSAAGKKLRLGGPLGRHGEAETLLVEAVDRAAGPGDDAVHTLFEIGADHLFAVLDPPPAFALVDTREYSGVASTATKFRRVTYDESAQDDDAAAGTECFADGEVLGRVWFEAAGEPFSARLTLVKTEPGVDSSARWERVDTQVLRVEVTPGHTGGAPMPLRRAALRRRGGGGGAGAVDGAAGPLRWGPRLGGNGRRAGSVAANPSVFDAGGPGGGQSHIRVIPRVGEEEEAPADMERVLERPPRPRPLSGRWALEP